MIGMAMTASLTACDVRDGGDMERTDLETVEASSEAETIVGSTGEEAAEPESTEPESSAESELSELDARVFAGEIVLAEPDSEWDLDRDGTMEALQLEYDDYEFTLTAGVAEITQEAWTPTGEMYVASLDGETLQVLVPEYGPSDDPQTYFFSLENGEWKQIGIVESSVGNMRLEEQQLFCREVSRIFQTVEVETAYLLTEGELQAVELEFYEMGNTVTAKREIKTYAEKDGAENGPVIAEGSHVVILGTDNQAWVQIETEDGETGWMKIAEDSFGNIEIEGEEVSAWECFDGLILMG